MNLLERGWLQPSMPKVSFAECLQPQLGISQPCTNTASGKEDSDFYLSQQGQVASISMLIDNKMEGQTKKKAQLTLPLG